MRRALSVANVTDAKFKTLDFDGEWRDAIGCPEVSGTWIIYGPPKNGKTSLEMMVAKYMTKFKRCAINSVEEGLSYTIKLAFERVNMHEVSKKVILWDKASYDEMIEILDRHKSPDVIFVDSVQFMDLKWSEYKNLKHRYPDKIFCYVSHIDGKVPEGNVAKRIWRDACVVFRVEGFKAFVTSRYGGDGTITISQERAEAYWGLQNK